MYFSYIILIASFLHGGESTLCFSCDSFSDPNCKDPFKKDGIMVLNCLIPHYQNNTSKTQVLTGQQQSNMQPEKPQISNCMTFKYMVNGQERTLRECNNGRSNQHECEYLAQKHQATLTKTFCNYCTDDYCNSAISTKLRFVPFYILFFIFNYC